MVRPSSARVHFVGKRPGRRSMATVFQYESGFWETHRVHPNQKYTVPFPLRVMIVADFGATVLARDLHERALMLPGGQHEEGFARWLRSLASAVHVVVPTPEGSTPVDLRFERLADFEPDALVKNLSVLSPALEHRKALAERGARLEL